MNTKKIFLLFALLLIALPAWSVNHTINVGGQSNNGGYYGGTTPVLMFAPSTLTIDAGDTVTFVNIGGTHNVVSDTPGLFRCANGCDGDGQGGNGNPAPDWTVTIPFNTAGTFGFHCEVHQSMGMVGTITVNATTPPPPSFSISTGTTGIWYDPAQSGHGFDVEVLDATTLVAIWYVFDANGNNFWLVGTGSYSGSTATLDVSTATGGFFPPNFDQTKVTRPHWGSFTFTFSDCNHGHVAWTPDAGLAGFTTGSLDITRLTMPMGLTCP